MNANTAPNTTENPTIVLPITPAAPLGVTGVDLDGVLPTSGVGVVGESEGVEGVVDGVEGVVEGVDGVEELSLTSTANFMPD